MATIRPLLIVGLALLAAVLMATPAAAQGWFGNFFGGGGRPMPRQGGPAYPGYDYGYGGGGGYRGGGGYGGGYVPSDEDYRPRRHVQKRKPPRPAEDVAKETPAPSPKNASLFVDVFGDSLGQMLADGLDDALADRSDVAVVHKAKGSSGIVASDFYDWPESINDLLAGRDGKDAGATSGKPDPKPEPTAKTKASRIDVAVMMVGSNDKQAIRENGQTLAFGTPEWTAAYGRRVSAIDEAFRAHGIPLIWVGVPITKDDGFADAMASLDDITREAAAKTGAVWVDTWEAFSDDNGDFSAYGPDVNGQTVRLRASDGIHFTKAGSRKLAHFVMAHVLRALEGKIPTPRLPSATEPSTADGKPVAAVKPDAGPIRDLAEAPDSKGGILAALPKPTDTVPDGLATTTMVHGEAMPIPAGRADDARWPAHGTPEP